jgi:hypothetical protein
MEIQHINVKLFVKDREEIDLEALIPVFHDWIQNQESDELLLDVADYRHVPAGPGMVLIGHYGNYSLDNTGGRLGVRYNRKAVLEGSNQERLIEATIEALEACQRLESEPRLEGRIRFHGREIELSVNDRLLAPNNPETRSALDAELRAFFSTLFGNHPYTLTYSQDPRSLFSVHVTTSREFDTTALRENLAPLTQSSI